MQVRKIESTEDEIYKAKEIVAELKEKKKRTYVTASVFQRHMRIGYIKALSIMDDLRIAGVLGKSEEFGRSEIN